MKGLKPGGRQAIIGVVMGLAFAFFWTYMTITMGAPIIFPVFGTGFILLMAIELAKTLQKYRDDGTYDEYEMMDRQQWNDWQQQNSDTRYYNRTTEADTAFSGNLGDIYQYTDHEGNIYCPYCGVKIAHDFEYCPKCGKKLPFEINY